MLLRKIKNRKGISPLIATLLLIAIAVAASVLTYSWVMSMIGSQSGQAQTQVRIDSIGYTYSNTAVVAIRNTGSIDATVESVWVRTNTAGSTWFKDDASQTIQVGKAADVTCTPISPVLVVNTSYVFRVTTTTGFYYEFISTTPAALTTAP
jgi:archaeal type IV pilus assembly protein PilA